MTSVKLAPDERARQVRAARDAAHAAGHRITQAELAERFGVNAKTIASDLDPRKSARRAEAVRAPSPHAHRVSNVRTGQGT